METEAIAALIGLIVGILLREAPLRAERRITAFLEAATQQQEVYEATLRDRLDSRSLGEFKSLQHFTPSTAQPFIEPAMDPRGFFVERPNPERDPAGE